jgi:hypothetical protein
LLLVAAWGCRGADGPGRTFEFKSESSEARVRYLPDPPARVFDSLLLTVQLEPDTSVRAESLVFELLPAENGWCRAVTSHLRKRADGWFEGSFWMRPTVPGQYVASWQTAPFTGFTFYLAVRYDSLGQLLDWDEKPQLGYPVWPFVVRDTMEIVYRHWPQVWSRRLHLVRRTDAPKEFFLITQSYQRSRGVSARRFEYSANLVPSPHYPLRSQAWDSAGWVVDTLSVWVRDTLVAWVAWSYDEIVDNWEHNTTLFRDWQHRRQPELYFKVDLLSHLTHVWSVQPADQYVAAKMYADTSRPAFDSLKRAFIYGPSPGAP